MPESPPQTRAELQVLGTPTRARQTEGRLVLWLGAEDKAPTSKSLLPRPQVPPPHLPWASPGPVPHLLSASVMGVPGRTPQGPRVLTPLPWVGVNL